MSLKGVRLKGNWRRGKLLAAVLAPVLALLISSGAVASPAMAAAPILKAHVCKQIGIDQYANTAIICTDLFQVDNGNGTYFSQVGTQAYCQNSANQVVQCANVFLLNETAYATSTGTHTSTIHFYACGHSNGPCPTMRTDILGNSVPGSPAQCIANTWGVTLSQSGNSVTEIDLPQSDEPTFLDSNYASPHVSVGNC